MVVREGFDAGFIAQALGYGVRGFLLPTCPLAMYGKALRVIQAGDIWAGRKILAEVALDLLRRQARPTQTSADGRFPAALAHLDEKRAPAQFLADRRPALLANNEHLTEREREVMDYAAQGMSNKEIARVLGVTEKTIKVHLHHVFSKLKVQRRVELVLHRQHR